MARTQVLRTLNIGLCVVGILYFGSFLKPANFPTSFVNVVWHLITQILVIFPQMICFLALLLFEVRSIGRFARHIVSLVIIVVLFLLGNYWSTHVIGAIES